MSGTAYKPNKPEGKLQHIKVREKKKKYPQYFQNNVLNLNTLKTY